MAAADEVDAPVIIQAIARRPLVRQRRHAEAHDGRGDGDLPAHPLCASRPRQRAGTCMTAIQAGFTSVMMDGRSRLTARRPGDWDYNVGVTKTVTDMAHLGGIRSRASSACWARSRQGWATRRTATAPRASSRTTTADRPRRAVTFVKETKWTRWPSPWGLRTAPTSSRASPTARFSPCMSSRRSTRSCPNTHLVMHGSSSVPQELQDVINSSAAR